MKMKFSVMKTAMHSLKTSDPCKGWTLVQIKNHIEKGVFAMKIAIIGCGTIANSAHIPAYMKNKEVEIKYFCDIIIERAEKAVQEYGCGIAVKDYHEVLADPEVVACSV